MKFLLDMPVSPAICTWLVERGHDVVHAAESGLTTASDQELLDRAVSEDRVVVTADTDFPQLLALSRDTTPGVILFRGGDYSREEMVELLARVLDTVPEQALVQSVCVVDRHRIRQRRLPLT